MAVTLSYGIKIDVKYEGVMYEKWEKTFRKNINKSLRKYGKYLSVMGPLSMKSHIKNARRHKTRYPENSILYKTSKGGKSVLYNVGFLRNAPRHLVLPNTGGEAFATMEVGILGGTTHPSGKNIQTIVDSIIKDKSWAPTPAQRKAYWAKVGPFASRSYDDRKHFKRQEQWHQPKRDFITGYIETTDITPVMDKAIIEAISATAEKLKTKIDLS